jgi:hypothetical protein
VYVILGGRWCDIFVLNLHAPTEENDDDDDDDDDVKDSFHEDLNNAFDKLHA